MNEREQFVKHLNKHQAETNILHARNEKQMVKALRKQQLTPNQLKHLINAAGSLLEEYEQLESKRRLIQTFQAKIVTLAKNLGIKPADVLDALGNHK